MGYAAAMKRLKQETLEQHIKDHPDQFEAVDTGYLLKKGGELVVELIYHGHHKQFCRHCQSPLKQKTMRLKEKDGKVCVVNGLSKEIEDDEGLVYVLWVCSKECEHCAKRQRVLPVFAARWLRHTLFTVAHTLLHLFENDELEGKILNPRRGRPVLTLPFYGELSTVYRWRQKIKIIFNS